MSDRGQPPAGYPMPPPNDLPPQRHGCATALMVVVGIILLLPGVCTLLVSGGHLGDPLMAGIGLITFLVFMGGIALIGSALRGRR
jgi:hypothetical protein